MCTAIIHFPQDHYFGRNLDLEYHYNEEVIIAPNSFRIPLRKEDSLEEHYAIIGIGTVLDGFPLYYDAMNEKGLCIAGLNFSGNAHYGHTVIGKTNITPFELIPWLLGNCADLKEARQLLQKLNLINICFREDIPLTPLHWMIADKSGSMVLEATKSGFNIMDNPVGVLTNNPPFETQLSILSNYCSLSNAEQVDRKFLEDGIKPYSKGLGAFGLPGDLSSSSRFVRAYFTRTNAAAYKDDDQNVTQFFHILNSVAMTEGCVITSEGLEKTVYSACCNMEKGLYYYKTYENHSIHAISLDSKKSGTELYTYPLLKEQTIIMQK